MNLSKLGSGSFLTAVIVTIVGAILTFAFSWAHNVSTTQTIHEVKLGVVEAQLTDTQKDIEAIKHSQLRIEDKLDRTLEKRR